MVCDTKFRPKQTQQQRIAEISEVVSRLSQALASGRIKAKVGQQGAIAFEGWNPEERNGVSDACAYRRIMLTGSALAKAAIARAEQIAGRSVDKQAVASGTHSHDGGATWHGGHK